MYRITFPLLFILLVSCAHTQTNEPTSFQWNFSTKKKLIYSFKQIVHVENSANKSEQPEKTDVTGIGQLAIQVTDNNSAELMISDLKMEIVSYRKDGSIRDTLKPAPQNLGPIGMNSNGTFTDKDVDVLFNVLLPLPSTLLQPRDSEKMPMKIPFIANETKALCIGANTLTFIGFKEFQERNCAMLEGIIDVSDLQVPDELKEQYKFKTTGNAKYYFDVEDGLFVGADVEMTMDMLIDENKVDNDSFPIYQMMKSENIFKIRLMSIED